MLLLNLVRGVAGQSGPENLRTSAFDFESARAAVRPRRDRDAVMGSGSIRLLSMLIENNRGPAAILNDSQRVVLANRKFFALAGRSKAEEVIGKRLGELFGCEKSSVCRGEPRGCVHCGLDEAPTSKDVRAGDSTGQTFRLKVHHPGANSTHVEGVVSCHSCDGQSLKVLVLEDVSGVKKHKALERVFLHDVLNTAGALKCLAEMLLSDRSAGPETKRLLSQLANQVVDEIQSYRQLSRAEKGELDCDWQDVMARETLETLRNTYSNHKAGLKRTIAIDCEDGLALVTDRGILLRVLGNLLKNALEASPPGGSVKIEARENGPAFVEFRVHNQGCIPPEVRAGLFKRFVSTKAKSGRGIGTYSVGLFTEGYLRGNVSYTTSESEGTTFTVILPRSGRASPRA